MKTTVLRRNPQMDIIRLCALFCVVSVHFFMHTEYYTLPIDSAIMYIATFMRTGFMICVPLFLLLSGYLLKNRIPEKKYYTKLIYTVSIYILSSFCCWLYTAPDITSLHDLVSQVSIFLDGLCNYSMAPYSWYVSMYIGLFILIPYLNILFNSLETKKAKQGLILAMLFLTSFPCVVNIFRFNPSWWLNPTSNHFYYNFLPTHWINLFPFTYYFIGAYLREYPLQFNFKKTALFTIGIFVFNGIFTIYRSYGLPLIEGSWDDYGSVLIILQAVLLFSLITKINFDKISDTASRFLSYLSGLCFGAYLVSWIFDDIIYSMATTYADGVYRLNYYIWIVPLVFVASLSLSAVINLVYNCIRKIFTFFLPVHTSI